jgi:lysophospholipase L1-like esterase
MKPAAKAALGLLVAAAVLALVEGGLRVAGLGPAYRADVVGWRMQPDLRRHRMQRPEDGTDFTVSTNADGLRTSLPREKGRGRVRVAVMGDSTVFGWGVEDAEALPARLEDALGRAGRADVEVLNAAQPGYSSAQLLRLYDDVIVGYSPDLVVFFPPQHDRTPALVSDLEAVRGADGALGAVRIGLARHSRLYHLLWLALGGAPGPDTASGEQLAGPGVVRVPRVSDAERGVVLDQLTGGGRPVVVGLFPFYPDLHFAPDAPGGDRPGVAGLRALAEARDLPVVDVRHCCGPDADALVFARDKWHLNARGNQVVAGALAETLRPLLP